jgi:predicted deacylase
VGTAEYMRFAGGYAVTVECGSHEDPEGPRLAYKTILNGLAHLGLTDVPLLSGAVAPQVWEIDEAVMANSDEDRLVRQFSAGEPVHEGERIGTRVTGEEIRAPYDGAIIFASVNSPAGSELCFFCKTSRRFG